MRKLLLPLGAALTLSVAGQSVTNQFLSAVPPGYSLQAFDDCGIPDRQPHVLMQDSYLWTFATSDTDAGPKERSAVFSYKGVHALYTNLDHNLSYVLALTYANDHVYNRVQSLEANGVVLHGPYTLPKAKATRVIVPVPRDVTREGKMALQWKIHGEVNATVSVIELWADAPGNARLCLNSLAAFPRYLQGQLTDLTYEGVAGLAVTLSNRTGVIGRTTTGKQGVFRFEKVDLPLPSGGEVELLAGTATNPTLRTNLALTNLVFQPPHYRPLPQKTARLRTNCLLLDGAWLIAPALSTARQSGKDPAPAVWRPFHVPGQFLQQGFDLAQDKPVALTKEFFIPKAWANHKLILRFDAVHGGARYRLNGHGLGWSENLFTPVEWDITPWARPGSTNRLELALTVDTVSEALSYSSKYAFHNLGGIDRSVRVFALPNSYIRELHLESDLDSNYCDGELRLRLGLESETEPATNLALFIKLQDQQGKTLEHSLPRAEIGTVARSRLIEFSTHLASPQPWSAEKPNLYALTLELRQGRALLERVQRQIGFRRIEIRDRQLLVNGHAVKLAGVCHHEFDPLTGRAETMRHAEEDVRLLKAANLNLIRTSHYPPTAELLEAADRLGMYVEVEAPFCWVGGALDTPTNLAAMLFPTAAMIDYHHAHPSVLFWSLGNESQFNLQFLASAALCKRLDPTRPTTFNNPDVDITSIGGVTDIANWHYPSWPFAKIFADDPRPVYFGEYFFPVCHEQTDVRINPGLRELWGQGSAEPDSAFSRTCAGDFDQPPIKPGIKPGGWSAIYHSDHIIGGSIWASHDDAFFFSETNHAGYAWHHGFWGLIDFWRRPKPEWFIARHIFSPVWLESRHVALPPGARTVAVPVENRYAFTDFSELSFYWQINRHTGKLKTQLAPGEKGQLQFPLPAGTSPGDQIHLRVTGPSGTLVDEMLIVLGPEKPEPISPTLAGPPAWTDDGQRVVVRGEGFSLVFDRRKGEFDPADPRHRCALLSFPTLHVTRYDFGDLNGPNSLPYAVFPDVKTRCFDRLEVTEEPAGLRLTVHEHYQDFAGASSWLVDRKGRGTVSCDYTYSGRAMNTREAGMRLLLSPSCDQLQWRRWSEWGVFPPETISRPVGSARAHRDPRLDPARWDRHPPWPWSLDDTELGTTDFRAIKYNIYQASLLAPSGKGISIHANADAHFRAALAAGGVAAHLLWRCPLAQVELKPTDRLKGEFVLELK